MKIALVHMRHSVVGGTESYLNGLSAYLARSGHEVTIVCRSHTAPSHPALRFAVLRPFAVGPAARMWTFARAVEQHVRETPYDVVMGLGKTWSHDVIRLGGGCHATYLARAHGAVARRRLLPLLPLKHRLALRIEARALAPGSYRRVIVNSRMVAEDVAARYGVPPQRLHVIYNGVDLERFHPRRREEEGRRLRAALGIDFSAPVVLFLGSGFARKGLDIVLDALSRLAGQPWRLLVVGRDSAEAHYRKQAASLRIADRVLFVGPRRDAHACYAAADLFVLPTRYDPFANATLEALASGLPVVTTVTNGAAELLVEGREGSVLPSGSPEAVARALGDWLTPGRAEQARPAARRLAERFSIEATARETEKVLQEAARERREATPAGEGCGGRS